MTDAALLDLGRTAAGSRLLHQWITQPLLDLKEIGKQACSNGSGHDAAFLSDYIVVSLFAGDDLCCRCLVVCRNMTN